jgi:hypothetical protein
VHKSKKHSDGTICFGGDMFIVAALLPIGLISQHYYVKDWNLFRIPEAESAIFTYDGHTSRDVLKRLHQFISTNNVDANNNI